MRRTIRLTGRKQLHRSAAAVSVREIAGKKALTFTIADPSEFKGFPPSARVEVRLVESKQMELVDFGTLGNPRTAVDLSNQGFGNPSCQLRIASTEAEQLGLLLGSTKSWRLESDKPEQPGGVRGLLNFLPAKIAPRAWQLKIEENTHPLIEIDNRIPDPKAWAKNDPIFVGTVMPAIIHQIFDDILCQENPEDIDWMNDWLRWADATMPGNSPPPHPSDVKERREWIDALIDTFCRRHRLSDIMVDHLVARRTPQ